MNQLTSDDDDDDKDAPSDAVWQMEDEWTDRDDAGRGKAGSQRLASVGRMKLGPLYSLLHPPSYTRQSSTANTIIRLQTDLMAVQYDKNDWPRCIIYNMMRSLINIIVNNQD